MYDVLGTATPTVAGALILPNTGGNSVLKIVAYISIVVGSAILLTTAIRFIAKKFVKA